MVLDLSSLTYTTATNVDDYQYQDFFYRYHHEGHEYKVGYMKTNKDVRRIFIMQSFIELIFILVVIFEFLIFLGIIGILVGWVDEFWRVEGNWKEVLYAISVLSLSIMVTQLLALGIIWVERLLKLGESLSFPNPIYLWGFRLVFLVGLLRAIWPRKHWSRRIPAPPHARLKLLGLALLAGALSFLPNILPV